jgi:copper(I)-binding protein
LIRRIAAIVILGACALALFWGMSASRPSITIENAKAVPVEGRNDMFMVTLDMVNDGAASTFLGASSPQAQMLMVMNPGHDGAALIVPGGGKASLAMDGAHLMLRGGGDDFTQGGFIPLTLSFANGQQVSTRVIHAGSTTMDHSGAGVSTSPAPTLTLIPPAQVDADGFEMRLSIENFAFVRVEDGTPHVPVEGHAHIYLNGLKLGRLYDTRFDIGALSPGSYDLRVALNSHDHRPYLADGVPVAAQFAFTIP